MSFGITIYRSGESWHSCLMVRNPFVVGRGAECDLVLNSRSVSRRHIEFKLKRAELTIKDLGSRNGSIVNGVAIEPNTRVVIRLGDVIQVGKFKLCVDDPNVESSVDRVAGDSSKSSKTENLLVSLEEFIRERIDGDIKSDSRELIEFKPDQHTVVPWTATKPKAEEDIADLGNEDTQLVEDSATVEKVSLAKTGDSMKAEAELRRLDLRKRMETTKAKDSREAADRALKKLFGGQDFTT